MALSSQTIEQVKQTADVQDVIADFLELKKSGSRYLGLCPFHDEKTPSFYVTPSKGIYKCFGCGASGDAIRFVMDYEGMSYPDAIRYLAGKYSIEILENQKTEEQRKEDAEREALYEVLEFAAEYFRRQMLESKAGRSIAYSYFQERGFSADTIDRFGLGYSPEAWQSLLQTAEQNSYSRQALEKAGLVVHNQERDSWYDRFRGRVMFPIYNLSGRVIGFGARLMREDPQKKQPKYLNSPDSLVYDKSKVLFGLYQAKNAIRKKDEALLVEGYTDVISLHQAGFSNAVAASGTSLAAEQVRLLGRYSHNLALLFDGDAAGTKAALRGIDLAVEGGLHVKAVRFPEGEDPDSYARRNGPENTRHYLEQHSQDFITFKAGMLQPEAEEDPYRKSEVVREMLETLTLVPDAIQRDLFLQKTAQILQLDAESLRTEYNKLLLEKQRRQQWQQDLERQRQETPPPPPVEEFLPQEEKAKNQDTASLTNRSLKEQEQETVRLLLQYGQEQLGNDYLGEAILEELADVDFSHPNYARIVELFRQCLQRNELPSHTFFTEHEEEAVRQVAAELLTEKYSPSEKWSEAHQIVVPSERDLLDNVAYTNIVRLKQRLVEKRIAENYQQLLQLENDAQQEAEDLMRKHMELKQIQKQLAQILGNVISFRNY